MGSGEAVDVGVDDHLVVEAEDGVVEGRLVEADLDTGDVRQWAYEGQGVADAGGDGALAQLLLFTASGRLAGGGVAKEEADAGSGLGLVAQLLGERWTFDQEEGGQGQNLDVLGGVGEESVPKVRGDVVAVGVDLDHFRLSDLGPALRSYRVRPEVVLGLADHRGDGVAVTGVGDAALGDPPFDGLGVHAGRSGYAIEVQTVAQQGFS